MYRTILFHGPPGSGKTTFSKSLAQTISQLFFTEYNSIILHEINSQSLYSKFYSESGKLVQKIFSEFVQKATENKNNLYFLLIDEVESLASSRERVMSTGEPTDSIRAVNALLTQLDRMVPIPNIFILATSNLISHIDSAFLDRIDLKIHLPNPSATQIYSILREGILELIRVKVVEKTECNISLPLLQCNHLEIEDLLDENPLSKKLYQIAKHLHGNGASGRKAKKAILIALSKQLTKTKLAIPLSKYIENLNNAKEHI